VASLRPKDIDSRYHLPPPTDALNEPFMKGFLQGNKGPMKLMKHWWDDEDETLKQGHKSAPTHRLKELYELLVAMLCHLYGVDKHTHF